MVDRKVIDGISVITEVVAVKGRGGEIATGTEGDWYVGNVCSRSAYCGDPTPNLRASSAGAPQRRRFNNR